jgi:DNA primase catalytic subunit
MSVTDWLFPERVGPKRKARNAVPIGGEFFVDVDSYLRHRLHRHFKSACGVCEGCLEISKHIALEVCDEILENYSNLVVVFSGRRGFHIHVLDFDYRDWARPNPRAD